MDLVFDGIDTVATIELNGEVVGRTANMHRGYRFDVGRSLRDGGNELTSAASVMSVTAMSVVPRFTTRRTAAASRAERER